MPRSVDWERLRARAGGVSAEPVAPGVLRLEEAGLLRDQRSRFYLLDAGDRALLIDGGWGLCRSRADLPLRSGVPLVAAATHSHFDHVGALHLADARLAHPAEADVFRTLDPHETQALPWLDGLAVAPGGIAIDPPSFRQVPCPLTGTLRDGDRLDLGHRRLTVLHVPGHSPGSIALFEETDGLLFCGDTVHDGVIHDAIPGADPAALLHSHARLAAIDFRLALPGHGAALDRAAFARIVERHRAAVERVA